MPGEPACAAAATERCHRPWKERCGKIGWRLAACDLLYWSGEGSRGMGRHKGPIPIRMEKLHDARGCALGMSLAEVVPGVTLAEAVEFLTDVGIGPRPARRRATDVGRRLMALGDDRAIHARCHEVMAALHNSTPRRPRT